jgi:hypothetical protein
MDFELQSAIEDLIMNNENFSVGRCTFTVSVDYGTVTIDPVDLIEDDQDKLAQETEDDTQAKLEKALEDLRYTKHMLGVCQRLLKRHGINSKKVAVDFLKELEDRIDA